MTPFFISQLFALGTLIAGMAAFQFRERKHILQGWGVAAACGAAHFWFLDAYEACFLVAVTATRFFVSARTNDSRLMYLFLAIALAGFAWTYDSPLAFMPLASTVVGTIASFRGSTMTVRLSMMFAEILWFIYNTIIWSPVAMAMEVAFFTSNLIGMIKHRRARPAAL